MPETAGDKLTPVIFFSTENHSTEKKKFNFKLMFSESQYSSSEPQQYDYFVMQEPVFEEKIEEPAFTHVYEENGVQYLGHVWLRKAGDSSFSIHMGSAKVHDNQSQSSLADDLPPVEQRVPIMKTLQAAGS